ncbi:MAG TPA: CopD family protein [Vicinamibacterales bacterium]|nr:CopD family protein [Vicinamibacterales bacterium]
MELMNRLLLVLHFLGLAMGLSVGLSSMVMAGLIDKSAPAEKAVLGRFPPLMSRVGSIGLALLWITGLGLFFEKWGGFENIGNMPWQFHLKLTLVVILSGLIGYLQSLQRRLRNGDASVMPTMQRFGRIAFLTAIAIVVCAVWAFD